MTKIKGKESPVFALSWSYGYLPDFLHVRDTGLVTISSSSFNPLILSDMRLLVYVSNDCLPDVGVDRRFVQKEQGTFTAFYGQFTFRISIFLCYKEIDIRHLEQRVLFNYKKRLF